MPRGMKADGSEVVMNCATKSRKLQRSWLGTLQKEIEHRQKLANLAKGCYANSFENMRLTR